MNQRNKEEGELLRIWHFHSGKYWLFSFCLLWENVPCVCNHELGLKSLWLFPFQVGQAIPPEPGLYLQSHGWGPAGESCLRQLSQLPGFQHPSLCSQAATGAVSILRDEGCAHKVWLGFSLLWKQRINHRSSPGETGRKVTPEQPPGCPPMPEITPAV